MNPFKLMHLAAGLKKPSIQQFVVADLQTGLSLEEPLPRKVRITDILKNIRVLGLFTPYRDYPVLPRYPDNALHKDVERVGEYMRKAIGQHGGRSKGP